MIHRNCVELYFPNGLSSDKISIITSTAHPLLDQDFNDGLRRYCTPIVKRGVLHHLEWGEVDPVYVRDNDQIVVARPLRLPFHLFCVYQQYEPDDFTLFLQPSQ
ncbi:MAG: hypothetical protein AAF985_03045 [Bacteroidota bacterium]